jgi:hypothetical protein
MDEKGFPLGDGSRAKVIARRGIRPSTETQDSSREWITVSTHLLQPLDVVLFGPLQKAYGDAVVPTPGQAE